jgi:type IV secretion system protein VirB5
MAGSLGVLVAIPARAQLAVVDAPAIVQLVQQVQTMEQQVKTAEGQLAQARQALSTMTGDRGMESLQSGVQRNYLPTTWSQLMTAGQGGGSGFPSLATNVQTAIANNAVLTAQQLATLSPAGQQQIISGRQASALQQALVQQALANVSARFASIQSLIAAIAAATDQKGILDLGARINAELGMLQNEQTKLQVLQQATRAQDAVNQQQQRERIVANHGAFSDRFQPSPAANLNPALQ